MSRILVVDDDPMIRDHLARILTRNDFTAITAADGIEALEIAERDKPALIVLDVMMPRADGREVLARLRRRGDWTPVILLTGVGQSGTQADALEKGADDYLNKPFDPAELVARIRAVLRRGQGGQTLSHASRVKGGGLELDRLAKTVTAKGWDCMMFAGERRMLRLGLDLWGVPIVVGGIVLAGALLLLPFRNRSEKAVQEATQRAQAAAREAHRSFVGRLDHELKNPLTALRMGIAEVQPPELAQSLQGQVERLSSLVAELRKISEIDAYPVADEAVDLPEVIETVVPQDRDVQLTFPRAPRPLPPVRGTVTWSSWRCTTSSATP